MAIDYSFLAKIPGAIPKTRPKALDKADQVKALEKQDKAENAKAKRRAKGQCEVVVVTTLCAVHHSVPGHEGKPVVTIVRCQRKDAHTHHLLYGIGRKNKGESVLAKRKIRTCAQCHADIHAKVLRPTSADADAATIRFWRVK